MQRRQAGRRKKTVVTARSSANTGHREAPLPQPKPSGIFALNCQAQRVASETWPKMSGSCSEIKLRRRALCVSWLSWALWGSLAPTPACGYVIVNSVSWSVPNEVEEELDSSSNEEALPALLEDTSSIWKQSYPASVYKEEEEMRTRPGTGRSKQISSPSRMFSYRRESSKGADSPALPLEQAARTARLMMHRHGWGFLATISSQEKVPPP